MLHSLLQNTHHTPTISPLLLLTTSTYALSPLPLLTHYIQSAHPNRPTLLLSVLYHPSKLGFVPGKPGLGNVDLTDCVPGFMSDEDEANGLGGLEDVERKVQAQLDHLGGGPVTVIVDSPVTLASNFDSDSTLIVFIAWLLAKLTELGAPSQLILPLPPHSPFLLQLSSTTLSPTLNVLTLHPPRLLPFLSETYHLLPPPSSSSSSGPQASPKFFTILSSLTARSQADEPSYIPSDGSSGWDHGLVVELLIRGRKGRDGVRRSIEAVRREASSLLPVRWETLESLSTLLGADEPGALATSDEQKPKQKQDTPTSSFNLGLTDAQRESRSAVPIPYAHEGEEDDLRAEDDHGGMGMGTGTGMGGIIYEPDEGDDMDEDDPDEDLEF